MFALLQYAQQLGITILNNCPVDKIEEETNFTRLLTIHGTFSCKNLVMTTNAFIKNLLPDIDIVPGRAQVLITKPIKHLKIEGTFHYDKGYYYFRNINNRILLGGGRNIDFKAEETTSFGQTDQIQAALESLLKNVILPQVNYEIDYRWSGIMAFGKTLEPTISQVRTSIFCATGCNGMGIAIGAQTGEDVANLLLNKL